MSKKIRQSAEELLGDASIYMGMPGKPLRGRWGTVAKSEHLMVKVKDSLGDVLSKVIPVARARGRGPGDEEDAEFQHRQQTQRQVARDASTNVTFFVSCMVSSIARAPVDHFFAWHEGRVARHKKA